MKKSVVKKSILARFLNMILPFYCRGCGKAGNLLCGSCKSNIKVVGEVNDVDLGEIDRLFVVGLRDGALKKLVEDYKFNSIKGISEILAELLDEVMPDGDFVVVPLPTIKKHIRERGFDHTKRLAEELARRRGWGTGLVLRRVNKTVQVGADEETRRKQAEKAYAVDMEMAQVMGLIEGEELAADKIYLLLDDVWTTGSSMRAAAKKLRAKGAKRIYAAVICKGR